MEPFIKIDDLYIIGRYREFRLTDSNLNILCIFKLESGYGSSPIRDISVKQDYDRWIRVATFESKGLSELEFLKHYLYQIEHPIILSILRDNKIKTIMGEN